MEQRRCAPKARREHRPGEDGVGPGSREVIPKSPPATASEPGRDKEKRRTDLPKTHEHYKGPTCTRSEPDEVRHCDEPA